MIITIPNGMEMYLPEYMSHSGFRSNWNSLQNAQQKKGTRSLGMLGFCRPALLIPGVYELFLGFE